MWSYLLTPQLSHPWNRWQMPVAQYAWIVRWAWGRFSMMDMVTVTRFAFFFSCSPEFLKLSPSLLWLGLIAALLFQLECGTCGHSWYASRDEVSLLTIDGSNSKRNIGTEPLATAKLVAGEKKLVRPRESDKSANEWHLEENKWSVCSCFGCPEIIWQVQERWQYWGYRICWLGIKLCYILINYSPKIILILNNKV